MHGLSQALGKLVGMCGQISTLVVAEFKNQVLSGSTLNTVGAAAELGGDITVLVAGLFVFKPNYNIKALQGDSLRLAALSAFLLPRF